MVLAFFFSFFFFLRSSLVAILNVILEFCSGRVAEWGDLGLGVWLSLTPVDRFTSLDSNEQ